MNIDRVLVQNLYGYMNKEIFFNKDINLLVGINGSGKTSILNVINWLLIPSFPNLCITEFDLIEIDFTFRNDKYKISSRQNQKEVTIDLENLTKNKKFSQVQADFRKHPKELTKDDNLKDSYFEQYSDLAPEPHEEETWEFLFKTLPNPIVIGLDRYIYTEEGNDIIYSEDSQGRLRKSIPTTKKNLTPLEKVLRLSGFEYMKFKNNILDLNKRLNDKIMMSSFDETLTADNLQELLQSPKITIKQVELLEMKVKNYFEDNINNDKNATKFHRRQHEEALNKIQRYFSNLKNILNQVKNNDHEKLDILYITNVTQFRKIKELIKEFEDFETKSKRFFDPLKQYLENINLFLVDSAKEIYFDKNSSKLRYRILDQNKKIIEENRDLNTLSSGEKQILILFTYIKFNNKLGKLFIIDEPELSLHPKWQESFLTGIKAIMPSNTQLLFATHSPAIVGRNKDYCKVLLPY